MALLIEETMKNLRKMCLRHTTTTIPKTENLIIFSIKLRLPVNFKKMPSTRTNRSSKNLWWEMIQISFTMAWMLLKKKYWPSNYTKNKPPNTLKQASSGNLLWRIKELSIMRWMLWILRRLSSRPKHSYSKYNENLHSHRLRSRQHKIRPR